MHPNVFYIVDTVHIHTIYTDKLSDRERIQKGFDLGCARAGTPRRSVSALPAKGSGNDIPGFLRPWGARETVSEALTLGYASPNCTVREARETITHLLCDCSIYDIEREVLLRTFQRLHNRPFSIGKALGAWKFH